MLRKRDLYVQHLRSEGYQCTVDTDGDVCFKREGGVYYIFCNEDDPGYFCLVRLTQFDESYSSALLTLAASEINKRFKVAKVNAYDDRGVRFGVELFLPTAADFAPVLDRCLNVIALAARDFKELADQMNA